MAAIREIFSENVAKILEKVISTNAPAEITEDQKSFLAELISAMAGREIRLVEISRFSTKLENYMNMINSIDEMMKETLSGYANHFAERKKMVSVMNEDQIRKFLIERTEELLREFHAVSIENVNQKDGESSSVTESTKKKKKIGRIEKKKESMHKTVKYATVGLSIQNLYKDLENSYGDALVELLGFNYIFTKMKKSDDKIVKASLSYLQIKKSGGKCPKEQKQLLSNDSCIDLETLSIGRMERVLLDLQRQVILVKASLIDMKAENDTGLENIRKKLRMFDNNNGRGTNFPYYYLEQLMRTERVHVFDDLQIRLKNSEKLLREIRRIQLEALRIEKVWAIELRTEKKLMTAWTAVPFFEDDPVPEFDCESLAGLTKAAVDSFVFHYGAAIRQSRPLYSDDEVADARERLLAHSQNVASSTSSDGTVVEIANGIECMCLCMDCLH